MRDDDTTRQKYASEKEQEEPQRQEVRRYRRRITPQNIHQQAHRTLHAHSNSSEGAARAAEGERVRGGGSSSSGGGGSSSGSEVEAHHIDDGSHGACALAR